MEEGEGEAGEGRKIERIASHYFSFKQFNKWLKIYPIMFYTSQKHTAVNQFQDTVQISLLSLEFL